MFSVGEKVRYLDEVGEATVLDIIDSKTVYLEDEFGLTHSYPANKLISAERDHTPQEKPVAEKPKVSVPTPKPETVKQELKGNALPELAIAFESTSSSKPETGDLELQFINSTKHHLLVNISTKQDEEWFSLYHGEVSPNSDKAVQSLRRQDIGTVSSLLVDVIFFGKTGFELRSPVSCRVKVKATRFVKSGNYLVYEGIENPAIIFPIEKEKALLNPIKTSAPTKKSSPSKVKKPTLPTIEEEVDLHLDAILGSEPIGMPDHEKFLTQMRHFERKLNHALTHKYVQITFIHGVGKGRLKDAIRNELKEYGLPYEDGAFHKYGVGATVVSLH